MTGFETACMRIFDERLADIAQAKQAIVRARRAHARHHALLSGMIFLYATLEGGTKQLFREYFQGINAQNLDYDEIKPCYVEYALRQCAHMTTNVQQYEARVRIAADILKVVRQDVLLPLQIPTESNLTVKVFQKLFGQMGLECPIRSRADESTLNHLLRLRNLVAHGERNVTVEIAKFDQMSALVLKLLAEVIRILVEAVEQEAWRLA